MTGAIFLALASPALGTAAGACLGGEAASEIRVNVDGLKDRRGALRLELYPDNDKDFLADDTVLLAAGKTFARVDRDVPPAGEVGLCIRAPGAGRYALSLLHDRNGDHRFEATVDGVGFAGNPRLGWSRPHASAASVIVGDRPVQITIRLNYLQGLSMRPIAR
ncbi:MAG TPA: DUF2141 domain-containing protein [Sphingomonas sp.]|nr:DUF2141 domain-containing protein [Sphingomonas sp.]